MQKKTRNLWPSIKRVFNMRSLRQTLPLEITTPSLNLLRSIHQITLAVFIDCICDQNYSGLNPHGLTATQEEIIEAWTAIYHEYMDNIADNEQKLALRLDERIRRLRLTLGGISCAVDRLNIQYSEEIVGELKKMLPTVAALAFDPSNMEQYHRDLDMTVTISKNLYVEKLELEAEYKELMPAGGDSNPPTRDHFDQLIVNVSKWMRFKVNRYDTIFGEFLAMQQDLRRAIKASQKPTKA